MSDKKREYFDWNDSAISSLKQMAEDGLTKRQIANAFGIPKSAVIGKVRRLGIYVSPGTNTKDKTARENKAVKERKPVQRVRSNFNINPTELRGESKPEPQPPKFDIITGSRFCALPTSRLVTLMEVTADQCKWPIGDVRSEEFRFCGAPVSRNSYCYTHGLMSSAQSATGGQSKYDVLVKAEQTDVPA